MWSSAFTQVHHVKRAALVPDIIIIILMMITIIIIRSGRALSASGHGVKRSWLGALTMPPAGRNTKLLTRNSFQFLKMEVFLPSSLGNQDTFPLSALHRVEEKSLYSVGGRGPWGRLRTRCHQTRSLGPGRASLSPRTFCLAC